MPMKVKSGDAAGPMRTPSAVAEPAVGRWPSNPSIYSIPTWVWLAELRRSTGATVDLRSVPQAEWDRLASLGVDAVWLLGVWERSPAGLAIANRNEELVASFQRALPDLRAADNVGSPFCIRRYEVDADLGGRDGLAIARRELQRRGLKLILDFVPNHVAPDHPWATEHPEYFIHGTVEEARGDRASFIRRHGSVYACGRDPYFPAWPDVVQLNAFNPSLRAAMAATLSDIADQCDGVRCDMAMLLINEVFARTWGERAGVPPQTEYWEALIPPIRRSHPGFLFIAEAYWDLEWTLQQQGFDFCYDKRLYDRLVHDDARAVEGHLHADLSYQRRLVRFIENHDEPRAAATFAPARERAAAVVAATLPGARLFHDGQFDGRTVRLPVFLARRPSEPADETLRDFYRRLLAVATSPALRDGTWRLCTHDGWPDNATHERIVAWCWEYKGELRNLVVVNLSDAPAQARIAIPVTTIAGQTWSLDDRLSDQHYERSGDEMAAAGLFVALPPWSAHLFQLQKWTGL